MQRSGDVASTGARRVRAGGELRALVGATLIGLLGGCAAGDDKDSSGFSGFIPNPSATNQTSQSMESGDASSGESGESGSSTSPVDPTTGPMTTGPMTTGPMTTDPMTTGPMTTDPMTTDSTTTTTTGDGTTTTTTSTTGPDETTGEPPPPPPPKDPQPSDGIYSDCFAKECDFTMVDVCLELTDAMMKKIDGFCSLLCNSEADCQPKPNSPAVTKCVDAGGDKFCLLQCNGVADCPTGMTCQAVNINGNMGKYCW